MEVTTVHSCVPGHESQTAALDSFESLWEQGAARSRIFRFLLDCVARQGDRLVDLGAGPCIFSKLASDMGCIVTAVDARTTRKPDDAELAPVKFVQADVRSFELAGYDIIVFVGLLYHFELPDQLDVLRRCAETGAVVILETQVHIESMVPPGETRPWARQLVRRGLYEGVAFPEGDNPMASVGNPESFWATEISLLAMLGDCGFEQAICIGPLIQSKYGARRFLLLNAGRRGAPGVLEQRSRENAVAARTVAHAKAGEYAAAYALLREVPPDSRVGSDPGYVMAVVETLLEHGDVSQALSRLDDLHRRARNSAGNFAWRTFLYCAQMYRRAGQIETARLAWIEALDHLRTPSQLEQFLAGLIKHDVQVVVAATFAYLEKRFAGEPPMLASIAKALYDLGTFDAAERVCSTALEKEPHNVQLLLLKGRTLARQNKVGEAAEAMGEALSLQPENIRVLQALVPLQFKLARWDAAEQNAQCLIRLSPGNPWGHSFLATVLKRKRLRSEALIHARRAAELEPKREQFRRQVEELSSPPSARPS